MTNRLCLLLAAFVFLAGSTRAAENQLTAEQAADGWLQLFDGETLFGWKPSNKANWRVEKGVIVVDQGDKGLLCTTTQFANYELSVDFRSAQATNSGIFLRTSPTPANVERDCYELNIAPADNPFPTGSFVRRKKAAAVADSTAWQTFLVTCDSGKFSVQLNGKQVLDYTDPAPLGRGFIGLQLNSGRVEFRNIRLKPLGLKLEKLGEWKRQSADEKFQTDVNSVDELHLHGGRGQLESKATFGDFVVRSQIRSNGQGSNSGLFFRSIPGQMTNGYECQLQNRYGKDGPDKRMIDCGTGGICRRQNARKIVAKDGEFYTLTLIAAGNHFASWVNGYPTADWTDTRKPDDNPRRGYRAAAGSLILQGHDAATDYNFRNLCVAELPPRRSKSK